MMKNTSHTYTFRIGGRELTLTSDDPPELVQRIQVYADRKISEASSGGLIGKETAPVIACLSLAEELLIAQDDNTRLREELWETKKKLAEIENGQNG